MSTLLDGHPWKRKSPSFRKAFEEPTGLVSSPRPLCPAEGREEPLKGHGYHDEGLPISEQSIRNAKFREQAVPRHLLSDLDSVGSGEISFRTFKQSSQPVLASSSVPLPRAMPSKPEQAPWTTSARAGPGPYSRRSSRFFECMPVSSEEAPQTLYPPLGRTRSKSLLPVQLAPQCTSSPDDEAQVKPMKRSKLSTVVEAVGEVHLVIQGEVRAKTKRKRLPSSSGESAATPTLDCITSMDCTTQEQRPSTALDVITAADPSASTRPTSTSSQSGCLQKKTKLSKRNSKINRSSQLCDQPTLRRTSSSEERSTYVLDQSVLSSRKTSSSLHSPLEKKKKKRKPDATYGAASTPTERKPDRAADAIARSSFGPTKEVQQSSCLRSRYRQFRQCTHCVSRHGGDSCRFRFFRVFPLDPTIGHINGQPFFESQSRKEAILPQIRKLNRRFGAAEIDRTKAAVTPVLLSVITGELRYVVANHAMYRDIGEEHRVLCDFCSTTVFGGSWLCLDCGREYCKSCYNLFPATTVERNDERVILQPGELQRLVRCHFKGPPHARSSLRAVSRFARAQLEKEWLAMVTTALEVEPDLIGLFKGDFPFQKLKDALALAEYRPYQVKARRSPDCPYTRATSTGPHPRDPAGLAEQSHLFIRCSSAEKLPNELFDELWSLGEPIVVDNCLSGLSLDWSPTGFTEKYGAQRCAVMDCETSRTVNTSVASFFSTFGHEHREIMKLKDWPPTCDFQESFPDLYDDFNRALPVPDYTRRDGVLNLSAHFPDGPSRPDLGPKMYNAYRAKESTGRHGSTRLHMDIADAINIMVYASEDNGKPGCAVWDIFRAEDAEQIRGFLSEKFRSSHRFTDPIHSQLFYLDSKLRQELHAKTGVVSWRIYQYPGQAIFIPAGCAHQVCNLADCIKIAMDFVSPHNIRRCQQLTDDFRMENFARVWKDDVLQLYNVLWYAWVSARASEDQFCGGAVQIEDRPIHSAEPNGDVPSAERIEASTLQSDSLRLPLADSKTGLLAKRLLAITIAHFEGSQGNVECPREATAELEQPLTAPARSAEPPEPSSVLLAAPDFAPLASASPAESSKPDSLVRKRLSQLFAKRIAAARGEETSSVPRNPSGYTDSCAKL